MKILFGLEFLGHLYEKFYFRNIKSHSCDYIIVILTLELHITTHYGRYTVQNKRDLLNNGHYNRFVIHTLLNFYTIKKVKSGISENPCSKTKENCACSLIFFTHVL